MILPRTGLPFDWWLQHCQCKNGLPFNSLFSPILFSIDQFLNYRYFVCFSVIIIAWLCASHHHWQLSRRIAPNVVPLSEPDASFEFKPAPALTGISLISSSLLSSKLARVNKWLNLKCASLLTPLSRWLLRHSLGLELSAFEAKQSQQATTCNQLVFKWGKACVRLLFRFSSSRLGKDKPERLYRPSYCWNENQSAKWANAPSASDYALTRQWKMQNCKRALVCHSNEWSLLC